MPNVMMSKQKIVAIVVTYYPEIAALLVLLDAIKNQVDHVVVVDNGSDEKLPLYIGARTESVFIPLGTNKGIATAQNVGIEWARSHNANYVLLFDQDSIPAPDMVAQLLAAAERKIASGVSLAAVGPRFTDARRENASPFLKVNGLKTERLICPCHEAVLEVDHLIASGCLIPMVALDKVGAMREELFIDYVDIEWGLRAKQQGLQSFGVCAAIMQHSLGDEPVEFLGKKLVLHSPLRHYYHFRNAVWLYRQNWLPIHWKLADGFRLFIRYGVYTLCAKPHLTHLRMMSLGIWHGLRGQLGMFRGTR
jgi:rhamnosyltransferase